MEKCCRGVLGCGTLTHALPPSLLHIFPTSPGSPLLTPNTLSHISPLISFPRFPLTPPTPQHTSPHLPLLPPHTNTLPYTYPHISPHILKVWRSYHVTKFQWQSFWQPKIRQLHCTVLTLLKYHCTSRPVSNFYVSLHHITCGIDLLC